MEFKKVQKLLFILIFLTTSNFSIFSLIHQKSFGGGWGWCLPNGTPCTPWAAGGDAHNDCTKLCQNHGGMKELHLVNAECEKWSEWTCICKSIWKCICEDDTYWIFELRETNFTECAYEPPRIGN